MNCPSWASFAASRITACLQGMPQDSEIKDITVAQARMLAARDGDLYLDGLTSLCCEVAEALAEHEGDLVLQGVATLRENVAEALAKHKGRMTFQGLNTLSDRAASALCENPDIVLPDRFRE